MLKKKYIAIILAVSLIIPSTLYIYSTFSLESLRETLNWYRIPVHGDYDKDPPDGAGYIQINYVYEDDKPVSGLHVNLVYGNKTQDIKTDENGELWLIPENVTQLDTYHRKKGYYSEVVHYGVKLGSKIIYNHTIRKYKGTRFYLQVMNRSGDPIVNAKVRFNLYEPLFTNEVGACYVEIQKPTTIFIAILAGDEYYETTYEVTDYWFWDKLVVFMG